MPDTAPHRNPWVDPISTPDKWFQWLKRKLEIDPPEELPVATVAPSGSGAFHGAELMMDGNTTVPSADFTTIEFPRVMLDTDGYTDPNVNSFTIPAGMAGVYLITVTTIFHSSSD